MSRSALGNRLHALDDRLCEDVAPANPRTLNPTTANKKPALGRATFVCGGEGGISLDTSLCLALRAADGCVQKVSRDVLSNPLTRGLSSHHHKQKTRHLAGLLSFVAERVWDITRHIHVPRPAGSLWLCKTSLLTFCRTHYPWVLNPPPQTKKPGAWPGTLFVAERVGFEPTVLVRGRRFSRPVHSTALPPLRILFGTALYKPASPPV